MANILNATPILISPPRLTMISLVAFVLFTSLPPSFYSGVVHEQDTMFLNLFEYIAFLTFVSVFLLGYGYGSKLRLNSGYTNRRFNENFSYSDWGVFILTLILILEIFLIYYSFETVSRIIPNIYLNFITDNAEQTKYELASSSLAGTFGQIVPLATGTLWWLLGRWRPITQNLKIFSKFVLFSLVSLYVLALIIDTTLLASRWALFPLLLGSLIVYYANNMDQPSKLRKLNVYLAVSPAILIGIFLFFSFARGYSGSTQLIYTLVGYGPASYNRFAAILSGQLNYHTIQVRIDDFGFLIHFPFIERFVNIYGLFGLNTDNTLQSYFPLVEQAGLNSDFIWASMFGRVFADFGVLAAIYIFVYGVIAGLAWKSILKGGIFGQLIYPWVAFSIIFWFGDNIFFEEDLQDLLLLALFVGLFERLFAVNKYEVDVN